MKRAAAAALLLLAIGGAARAEPTPQDRETARALLDAGDKKVEAKDYAGALRDYRAADTLMGVPTTKVEVAKTLALVEKLIEARDLALEIVRAPKKAGEPAAYAKARQEADALAASLVDRIPSLRVTIEGPPPGAAIDVSIDGTPVPEATLSVPRKVDPGTHALAVSAAGYQKDARRVVVEEGQSTGITIVLLQEAPSAAASAPVAPSRSPLVYVGFGIGAAGLAAGTVTGILSLGAASRAKSFCDASDRCAAGARPEIDRSRTLANVSDIAFAAGAAGVVLGVVGLAISPSRSQPAVVVAPAVGGAVARGFF